MVSTTKRINVFFLVAMALFALTLSSCGSSETWQFTLKSQKDKAVIDMDKVTLIFEGVPMVLPQDQTGGGASGSLVVSGSGTAAVTVTAFGKSFTNYYNEGVNSMSFEGYTFNLLDTGTKLRIGTQVFDLTGEKKTIVIHKSGGAIVIDPN
ncbi:MAG: hypothetical protein IH984_05320 [Planctomycetes bacterium]|nr:hypothetical protein [Planctomycetota bacterium]